MTDGTEASTETDVTEASTDHARGVRYAWGTGVWLKLDAQGQVILDDAQGSGPPTTPKDLTETEPALDAQGQVITDANGQVFLGAKVVQIVTNSPSATIEKSLTGWVTTTVDKAGVRRVQEWTTIAFAVQNVDRWARTAP